MPIYEFKCNTCAAEFEAIVASFSKVNEVTCGKCGSVDINRILSTVNSKVKRGGSFPAAAPPPGCRAKSGFS